MAEKRVYVSHDSALHFWRTNPPRYVLDGAGQSIRILRFCSVTDEQVRAFCLSEAEFGPRPVHVLVPVQGPRPRSILHYHVQKAPIPPHSLYPLRDGVHVVSPELCFVQLCQSLTFVESLELGMELCGTYALRPFEFEDMASRDYQLTSVDSIRRKTQTWKEIHGLAQARKVAQYLVDGSASPMETKLYLLLCLPQKHGGYNIERPELNPEISLPEEFRNILHQDKVKPDFLWRKRKVVLEYDGEYHDGKAQALRDERRRMVLEAMGYSVIKVKKQHVYDPLVFGSFAETLAKRLGKRLRPLTSKQEFSRENLRETLLS